MRPRSYIYDSIVNVFSSYDHLSAKVISKQKHVAMLHDLHLDNTKTKIFLVPALMYGFESKMLVWFLWMLAAEDYMSKNEYKEELWFMSMVCWPITPIIRVMRWRLNQRISESGLTYDWSKISDFVGLHFQ